MIFTPNDWFQRLRDFGAQNLIGSTNFDAAQNLEIAQEPRNRLETIVMCCLYLPFFNGLPI
jgi:hypothetical protein